MTGENKFFDTLSDDQITRIPGGAKIEGSMEVADNDYIHEYFNRAPITVNKAGIVASGTNGAENVMQLENCALEYHMINTGGTSTIISPQQVATGLDVSMDADTSYGAEISTGILASNKCTFTVGTSAAFFAKLRFAITDVTDAGECAFGFRKMEAYNAAIDDYDEMACINIQAGVVNTETILNGGGTVTTDTTLTDWGDTETHELAVFVSAAGVVTYQYDGGEPTTVVAYTFDDTEVVIPFFHFLHAADSTAGIILKELEIGLQ